MTEQNKGRGTFIAVSDAMGDARDMLELVSMAHRQDTDMTKAEVRAVAHGIFAAVASLDAALAALVQLRADLER